MGQLIDRCGLAPGVAGVTGAFLGQAVKLQQSLGGEPFEYLDGSSPTTLVSHPLVEAGGKCFLQLVAVTLFFGLGTLCPKPATCCRVLAFVAAILLGFLYCLKPCSAIST